MRAGTEGSGSEAAGSKVGEGGRRLSGSQLACKPPANGKGAGLKGADSSLTGEEQHHMNTLGLLWSGYCGVHPRA